MNGLRAGPHSQDHDESLSKCWLSAAERNETDKQRECQRTSRAITSSEDGFQHHSASVDTTAERVPRTSLSGQQSLGSKQERTWNFGNAEIELLNVLDGPQEAVPSCLLERYAE